MEREYSNVYYIGTIYEIGGVETFLYELARQYRNKDLVFFYTDAPKNQIDRIRPYVRIEKYLGQKIRCKKAFFNYNTSIISNIEAEEYIQIIHADFEKIQVGGNTVRVDPRITKYYGVSQKACDSFSKITGKKCLLCHNPIQIDPPKKVLNLISATRLSSEKGKDRMVKLAEALDKAKIPYLWTVFTNDTQAIENDNIIYMKPRLDIRPFIAKADYTVQLSDTEGYCYTVLESLSLGTPVIITPVPSFFEQGVNDENSIVLDFDMKNIPIEKIYNQNFNFKYTPKKSIWGDILYDGIDRYSELQKTRFLVQAKEIYQQNSIKDKDLGRVPKKDEQWIVPYSRIPILMGENIFKQQLVDIIKEIKEEKSIETKKEKGVKVNGQKINKSYNNRLQYKLEKN